jgi:hypothetical protein
MKKLILALIVLESITSCGKNNSVSSVPVVNPAVNSVGISIAISGSVDSYGRVTLANYITDINNNAFGAARADSETFRFLNSVSGSTGNGCPVKTVLGGLFSYYACSSSSSTSSSNYGSYDTVNVIHSTQDLTSKRTELLSLIAQSYQNSNSSDRKQLYIKATNGDVYTIDFRIPMSANPVVKYIASTGSTRTFDYSFSGYAY